MKKQGDVKVTIGSADCAISSFSSSQIQCSVGQSSAGSNPILVQINNVGYANKNIQFTYDLSVSSLSSTAG
jgi:hypothetical protein